MKPSPAVTFCVLTYGDHERLARQCLESIRRHCERSAYRLHVGGNQVSPGTKRYLEQAEAEGHIDRLVLSPRNLYKSPMMRLLFQGIDTEFTWWFDDDSYIESPGALPGRVAAARGAPATTALWGLLYHFKDERYFNLGTDAAAFVRQAPWYRGLPPPAFVPEPGDPRGWHETPASQWFFGAGGCWFARTSALRALDWPDRRLLIRAEDVMLGEALRQHGYALEHIGPMGVQTNTENHRLSGGERAQRAMMLRQVLRRP